MTNRVLCPRCGQDYVQRVELVALSRSAILCPECDALWFNRDDVRPPNLGSYGVDWFDYGTYMKTAGRPSPHQKDELRIVGDLLE